MKKILCIYLLWFIINTVAHGQVGKIGINTSSPQAMFHVKDSSALFTNKKNH